MKLLKKALGVFLLIGIASVTLAQETHLFVAATNVRIRSLPTTKGKVVATLKLGTYGQITAKSNEQEKLIGKTDYWYKIKDNDNAEGWIFGGLTAKANESTKLSVAAELIQKRLKMTGKPIKDEEQIYEFAKRAKLFQGENEEKARLEMLYLDSIQKIFDSLSMMGKGFETNHKTITENKELIYYHESAGQHFVSPRAYWALADKYKAFPGIAEEISWKAAEQQLPGETEGDPTLMLAFFAESHLKYIERFPLGPKANKILKYGEGICLDISQSIKGYFAPQYEEAKQEFLRTLKEIEMAAKKCKNTQNRKGLLKAIEKVRQAL